jgi:hypothetical protein
LPSMNARRTNVPAINRSQSHRLRAVKLIAF